MTSTLDETEALDDDLAPCRRGSSTWTTPTSGRSPARPARRQEHRPTARRRWRCSSPSATAGGTTHTPRRGCPTTTGPRRRAPPSEAYCIPKAGAADGALPRRRHPGPTRVRRRPQPPAERAAASNAWARTSSCSTATARSWHRRTLAEGLVGLQQGAVRAVRHEGAGVRRHERRTPPRLRRERQPAHGVRPPARLVRRSALRRDHGDVRRGVRRRTAPTACVRTPADEAFTAERCRAGAGRGGPLAGTVAVGLTAALAAGCRAAAGAGRRGPRRPDRLPTGPSRWVRSSRPATAGRPSAGGRPRRRQGSGRLAGRSDRMGTRPRRTGLVLRGAIAAARRRPRPTPPAWSRSRWAAGGAHDNPRTATWSLLDGALREQPAEFELFGGERAIDVVGITEHRLGLGDPRYRSDAAGPAGRCASGARPGRCHVHDRRRGPALASGPGETVRVNGVAALSGGARCRGGRRAGHGRPRHPGRRRGRRSTASAGSATTSPTCVPDDSQIAMSLSTVVATPSVRSRSASTTRPVQHDRSAVRDTTGGGASVARSPTTNDELPRSARSEPSAVGASRWSASRASTGCGGPTTASTGIAEPDARGRAGQQRHARRAGRDSRRAAAGRQPAGRRRMVDGPG